MKQLRYVLSLTLLGTLASACSVDKLDKNDSNEIMAQTYDLERQWQRVQRFDCSGRLVSDKIETIKSPTRWVKIEPDDSNNLASSSFTNLTNGERAGCVTNFTTFQIDYAPGWCNMRVEEGLNKIQYSFSYCSSWSAVTNPDGTSTRSCLSPTEVRETGILYIRIAYREESLNGVQSIHPTPEECN